MTSKVEQKSSAETQIKSQFTDADKVRAEHLATLVHLVGVLVIISVLVALYFTAEIVLPIFIALLLNLVLRPLLRRMHKLKCPNALGAVVIIFALIGGVALAGAALSVPATDWGEKLPTAWPQLKERLQFVIQPITVIQKTVSQAENATSAPGIKTMNVAVRGDGLSDKLFSSTKTFLGSIFKTLLILFFLLLSGDTFQQRFIEILPNVRDKKKALEISHKIEADVSSYLRTITLMNVVVGALTTAIMFGCRVSDPFLWGTVAFLLNYVPILGPILGICLFILVGALSIQNPTLAFLPAALYFVVHIVEGEVVTPLIVSKRFILNPALVILMLIFWFWMWGVAGAILATPMLAILKIVCDNIQRLKPVGHLIEG